jgi:hypothetical protein
MSDPRDAAEELRAVIASKLLPGQTVEQATEALMKLFADVEDGWETVDIATWSEPEAIIQQRLLVCRVFREGHRTVRRPQPNRSVVPSGLSRATDPTSTEQGTT